MMRIVKLMFCAAVVSAAALPVCGADDDEKGEDTRPYVSINQEDVLNKTDNRGANFSALIDRLNNDLVETGLYRVMNMDDAVKAIKKHDQLSVIGDDGGGETKITTPAFFIGMTITTYGLTSSGGQNPLSGSVSGTEVAKIELILKVVDARTGETIKSKNIDGSAVGQVTDAVSNLREQVLQAATKKACEKIVYELVKLTPFGVLDVDNGIVSLDVPGTLKIMGKPMQPGMQFVVSKLGKGKKSRRTGKVTRSEKQVALVALTSVGEESCSAQILSGAIPPIGDDEDTQYDPYIVKINEGAVAPPAPPPPAPPAPPADGAPF